ncbi:MAG: sugar acetyltransferase [Nitrospirae bacterium GWC2_56_14]|nr:MAG: sugar acetyltransferase [Nitrospirae bacterium GWC2_56_14]
MNLPVLIVGGGGHAKVLIEALRLSSAAILGIIDADPAKIGTDVLGIHVIGDDTVISQYAPDSIRLVNALGSVHLPKARKAVFEKFKEKGFTFATIVHPSAVVASDAALGEGAQIMAGAIIQPGSRIGMNTIVNTKASVDHDCLIGDHVHLSPGVTLSGDVRIDNGVHIGTGATVIQGITIGANSLVGAGSVVIADVPAEIRVLGAPARKR